MNYVINPIDHTVYDKSLMIIGRLLNSIFKQKREVAMVLGKQENEFDRECINRLEYHLMIIVKQISNLELTYQNSIYNWLSNIK